MSGGKGRELAYREEDLRKERRYKALVKYKSPKEIEKQDILYSNKNWTVIHYTRYKDSVMSV